MSRVVSLDSGDVSAQGGPWALHLYQREFSEPGSKADWYADYVAAFSDFAIEGNVDPFFLLKTLWAMARNADDSVPSYQKWLESVDCSMALNEPWQLEVVSAINAEIFRRRVEEAGEGGGGL